TSTARTAAALVATEPAATDNSDLELYPTPATDHLQLRTTASLASSHYQILNALGQVVASGAADAGSLNVASLQAGLYTLQLTTAGQPTLTRRFVK
ncbi:MAG: T9SS type A sorting domain-containing protein, partial [Hymenobacter sp.]